MTQSVSFDLTGIPDTSGTPSWWAERAIMITVQGRSWRNASILCSARCNLFLIAVNKCFLYWILSFHIEIGSKSMSSLFLQAVRKYEMCKYNTVGADSRVSDDGIKQNKKAQTLHQQLFVPLTKIHQSVKIAKQCNMCIASCEVKQSCAIWGFNLVHLSILDCKKYFILTSNVSKF